MSEKLIELKNVTFTYDGDDEEEKRQSALTDIDLTINKGEFVAVLGHNGSGKSTLAKLCNAVYEPTEGTVTVKGIVSGSEENDDKIRRVVGMVFQNPDNQIVATIVEDDVAFGPENLGIEPKEIRKRVDDALKSVNMYELRHREPHKLSGGQKQRVAIAGVLAMQTECIVLDEPTAMLDPMGRAEVMSTVHRLNKELGITVVLVTHFMEEAVGADRIVVMDSGRIVMDGTPAEVFSQTDKVRECGLDIPQPTELCRLLGLGNAVLSVDECVERIAAMLGGKV
ncbi:MAG: energy-coupling factor transporter ATPase [Clostridium sp.]|jgi:energy-coupling factor transport system ATP-binding protein|nr:energy-coupling factor transporter ATPase [Clostridium sp.]MCI5840418.1 energy-coupling factor transporter ATPase [Clostridium sp.]MDY5895199.1 energy-coupling factor transporter ATPase [Oscillospiraceae bacterium]